MGNKKNVVITDGLCGRTAKVTEYGQVVTAPLDFSDSIPHDLLIINTAYNFFGPRPNKIFIITAMVFSGEKTSVGVNGATVDVYEADSATSTTVEVSKLRVVVPQITPVIMTGLNLKVSTGKWLNAKTDDNNVLVTIMGYYA